MGSPQANDVVNNFDTNNNAPDSGLQLNGENEIENLLQKSTELVQWLGVQKLGKSVTGEFASMYERNFNEERYALRDGFTSLRGV